VHEVALYNLLEGQVPSIGRIALVIECFNSTREQLDLASNIDLETMSEWACVDWRSLNYALMVNSRAAIILDSYCYGDESVERAAWVDSRYDDLCQKVELLSTKRIPRVDCFLDQVSKDWQRAKQRYYYSVSRASSQMPAFDLSEQHHDSHPTSIDNLYNLNWSTFGGYGDWTVPEGLPT
jgi:hypothetical protein